MIRVGGVATRGSSGATFTQTDFGTMCKHGIGNDRVRLQGEWLQKNSAPGLVQVWGTGLDDGDPDEDYYTMELLSSIPIELMDTRATIAATADILTRDVWSKPAAVKLEVEAHIARTAPLMKYVHGDTEDMLATAFHSIDWDAQVPVLTHGDPIIDNLMMRGDQLVLIDPIPATTALPDLRCVDLGRLVQSAAGYEQVRYKLAGPDIVPLGGLLESYCSSAAEVKATLYFAAIHLMRSMVYVDKFTARMIRETCLSKVMEELQWTL